METPEKRGTPAQGFSDIPLESEYEKEVLITKEYKTMGGFLRACGAVLIRVFGDYDALTMVTNYVDSDLTVEEKIRAGEFVEYNHGSGLDYNAGFEFEFPDRIYAFCYSSDEKKVEWQTNFVENK